MQRYQLLVQRLVTVSAIVVGVVVARRGDVGLCKFLNSAIKTMYSEAKRICPGSFSRVGRSVGCRARQFFRQNI